MAGGTSMAVAAGWLAEMRERQAVAERARRRALGAGDERRAHGLAAVVRGYDRLIADLAPPGVAAAAPPELRILPFWRD